MDIIHRQLNRVDILKIRGRLDASTVPELHQQFQKLFAQGRQRIILDLEELEYISSPGLRELLDARKKTREWKLSDMERGDIRLACLPLRIREVFDLTGLTALFEIHEDVVAAVDSF